MEIIQGIKNLIWPPIDNSLRAIPPYLQEAWKEAGFNNTILMSHPDFADALYKGNLIPSIQEMKALQNEAGLYVEGDWKTWAEVLGRFTLDECDPEKDPLKRQLIFRENATGKTFFHFKDEKKRGLQHLDQRLLEKWTAAEFNFDLQKQKAVAFDLEILLKFPEFAQMLRNTRILDQMQAMGVKPEERNGEPAIKINSELMGWKRIQEQFEWPSWDGIAKRSDLSKLQMPVGEKDHYLRFNVLLNKETKETYFYCGGEEGLQPHDAVDWNEMPTVAVLSDNEIARVQEVAQRFFHKDVGGYVRDNKDRNFVMQIVASREKESSFAFNDTTSNPCHPYVNIIATEDVTVKGQTLYKGHVYQIGFWGARVPDGLTKLEGRFYSYDPHSLRSYRERLVTSMAVSEKEVRAVVAKMHDRKNWRPVSKEKLEVVEEPQGLVAKTFSKISNFCCETSVQDKK